MSGGGSPRRLRRERGHCNNKCETEIDASTSRGHIGISGYRLLRDVSTGCRPRLTADDPMALDDEVDVDEVQPSDLRARCDVDNRD